MMRRLVLALCLVLASLPAQAVESVLTLSPRPGVTLRILTDRPAAPIGSVVLMAGGDGVLDLDERGGIGSNLRENHLVRTRNAYVRAGYAVFVPDIASDQKGTRGYRFGTTYAQDVAAVISAARQVKSPVVLIGTSRGALSVVAAFANQSAVLPDAAVISSGVLMGGDSASTLGNLDRIAVPVLLLRHRLDSCRVTPPADADRFKALLTRSPRVDIVTLDGGGPRGPTVDACGASHYHGFYGMDDQAVAATVNWLATAIRR